MNKDQVKGRTDEVAGKAPVPVTAVTHWAVHQSRRRPT